MSARKTKETYFSYFSGKDLFSRPTWAAEASKLSSVANHTDSHSIQLRQYSLEKTKQKKEK